MDHQQKSLDIAIVGAGLAGALAARVLRELHNVTIYERSRDPIEVGAAINVGPNGVRILDQLGFDRSKAGSLPVGATKVFNKEGKMTLEKYPNYRELFGADWLFQHRADLRNEFLRLATAPSEEIGVSGKPAEVRWGCEVKNVDTQEGNIVLASGEELRVDLIVGADGIKSVIRPCIVGDTVYTTARPSGLSAFRFTLETFKIVEALGEIPEVLDRNTPTCLTMVFDFGGTKRSVVMYPCRNKELLNLVCICPDESLKEASTESWSAAGDRDELLSLFKDFPDWVLKFLSLAENIKLWQLRDQDPLPTYVDGRAVLIGDAAHAMTPLQGQGGTQAVEDAEGFRLFLKPGITRADVPNILKDFDSVRRPRASQIQDNTRNAMNRRTAEEVHMFEKYNWTYPGIEEGLARVKAGQHPCPYNGNVTDDKGAEESA